MPLVYRFRLSDREIARAWLLEYFRRPGRRVWRVGGGPILIAIGIGMRGGADGFVRAMGIAAIVLGIWYAIKPFVSVWAMVKTRQRDRRADVELEVTVDDVGVRVDDGKVRTELPWAEIRGAGLTRHYVWFELGRGSRGTIPRRAIADLDALRTAFVRREKWQP